MATINNPPRPRLAFRIGVVGHRPNRLQNADLTKLREVLREILLLAKNEVETVMDSKIFAGKEPVLRAISPLAEGVDRIFAHVGIELGFELCCVMPFARVEYEKDFSPEKAEEQNSLEKFRDILNRTEHDNRLTTFELDGVRGREALAYSVGGRVVLNQSDLLIVVWDGEYRGKIGGTEETMSEALQSGVPVVWIDAKAPHCWQIVDDTHPLPSAEKGGSLTPIASKMPTELVEILHKSLQLAPGSDADAKQLATFLQEKNPAFSLAIVWDIFRSCIGDKRLPSLHVRVKNFEDAVKGEWPDDDSTPVARMVNWLRPFYAWPDKLAVLYANRYRSAFLLAFLLAAFAVGMALLPAAAQIASHQPKEFACIGIEFIAIIIILFLIRQGRRKRWHERWIDYRMLAELVRHLRLVAPLGGKRPFPSIPAHWMSYGQPSATWMGWYIRAVERDMGLPTVVMDKSHLTACLSHLKDKLNEQVKFHRNNSKRSHRIELCIHTCEFILLTMTLLACSIHFMPGLFGVHLPSAVSAILTFFCGFLPALGAALVGIVNQGEFLRVHKRSKAMKQQLKAILKEVKYLSNEIAVATSPLEEQYSQQVTALTANTARLLLHEVFDWRVVFLDRPLTTPP
jgi:hypothetical protein